MAKMTKAQARKRLREAKSKIVKVAVGDVLDWANYKKLDAACHEIDKIINKLK